MPIYEAIFRYDDKEEKILISNIEEHEQFSIVKNNIYCTYEGCNAKLEYVPKGKVRAHFKTWPKQNHIEDCIDFFEREENARKQKNIATTTMALSDKHIKSVLDNLRRKRIEQEKGINRTSSTKKKPRPKVKPTSSERPILNVVPTTGADAELYSGENNIREPSVKNRSFVNLTDDDIGFTRSIEGYIQNVSIEDSRVVLDLYENNINFKVYFEEFFFNNAPFNFRGRFDTLQDIVESNKNHLFSGVGLIEKRNESYGMLVNNNNDFYVDYQYLTVFIHTKG